MSTRIDGAFRRFPLGARAVGQIPQTMESLVVNDDVGELGLADHTWLMLHEVRAFAAVPLVFEGECIGVAAVFARDEVNDARLSALQSLATLAAGVIAGAGQERRASSPRPAPAPASPAPAAPRKTADGVEFLRSFDATERDILERVLEHTRGRVSGPHGAATLLGLKPTTLHSRMKKLGVERRNSGR